MQVLTEDESRQFLRTHSLGDHLTYLDQSMSRTKFWSNSSIGRRYGVANSMTNHLITAPESIVCLDITDWGVFPSIQNMDLFDSYREFLGEPRSLGDAHFHVFAASEAKQFRNILHLALISLFDVAGASTTTDFRFYASHDGYIDVSWYEGADWLPTMSWIFAP